MKVDRPGELAAAFTIAEAATHGGAPAYEGGVLVEEYLEGPEFSVDGALHRGHYQPFVVARKRIGFPPYFEETGHIVTAADTLRTTGGTVGIRFANPAVRRERPRRLRFVACQVPRRKPQS